MRNRAWAGGDAGFRLEHEHTILVLFDGRTWLGRGGRIEGGELDIYVRRKSVLYILTRRRRRRLSWFESGPVKCDCW